MNTSLIRALENLGHFDLLDHVTEDESLIYDADQVSIEALYEEVTGESW